MNGSPFHALQAWLQGQEDLAPWLQWRHRLFWLDEWVSDIRRLLSGCQIPFPPSDLPAIPELGRTSVVLRHDLDYSRDTSYLDLEVRLKVPAVHAVLRDSNTRFWVSRLRQHPDQESAFHYNTARYSRLGNWLGTLVGRPQRTYIPDRSATVRDGLLRQVRWARRRGIGVATLHRHLAVQLYPEWIDALDRVFSEEPEVLGGSSMFRTQVLRWGVGRADGGRGTYVDHPDAQFPYWFPFKLAHAAGGGRVLRGWESASLLEIEPDLFAQMLDHHVPGIPQRLFTLNFHPGHARRSTFVNGGSYAHFQAVLEMCMARDVRLLTLREAFEAMNRFGRVQTESAT
jgi:hypothetical protein